MRITQVTKHTKMHVLCMAKHQFDSADEGQNWDIVMFLVTILEMILTGFKEKENIIFIVHLRINFVAFLMSLSIYPLKLDVTCLCSKSINYERLNLQNSID